jgi:hypothetical protein
MAMSKASRCKSPGILLDSQLGVARGVPQLSMLGEIIICHLTASRTTESIL